MNYDKILSDEIKSLIITDYIENKLSLKEIAKKYGIKSSDYIRKKLLKGYVRNLSDSIKIAHERYPEHYKHSEETKQKMREKRLKFMCEHPEKTAWQMANLSYPEKRFKDILIKEQIDKRYLIYREYCVFPYYIDFAFIDIKVGVEIDGSQHLEEDRHKRDLKKDELLISKGWRVLRFTASDVINKSQYVLEELMKFIGSTTTFKKVGILKSPKKSHQKVKRDERGLTEAIINAHKKMRKVINRPSKEELWDMVCKYPFTKIAKDFNVSDKAIVKWCKYYGLPSTRKEINRIINKI